MSAIKFDADGPAARKLAALAFGKLRECWDPELQEDAVAQYAVALVARGWERKKVFATLLQLMADESATDQLLDWCAQQGCSSEPGTQGRTCS